MPMCRNAVTATSMVATTSRNYKHFYLFITYTTVAVNFLVLKLLHGASLPVLKAMPLIHLVTFGNGVTQAVCIHIHIGSAGLVSLVWAGVIISVALSHS